MLVKTYGSAVNGIEATTISIEVDYGKGKIGYYFVGLPDNAVSEGKQRIQTALKNSGFKIPRMKFVVNLAPADIRKEGSAYDLGIAAGILGASNQMDSSKLGKYVMMGELGLDGSVVPLKGALSIALQAKKDGFKHCILPKQNAEEAALVKGISIYGVSHINDIVNHFEGRKILRATDSQIALSKKKPQVLTTDLSEVKGQENVKRAMEIAAAGGHNVILIGPPGAGKTMIARCLPGILPPLALEEAIETTRIYSVAGLLDPGNSLISSRPFRSPHHTVSDVALVGGGGIPQPGEISLAHNGILFLDELPEFKRNVLEVLRQPIEERVITISRARVSVNYPANFTLIAAMNPCPCGFLSHPERKCTCSPFAVSRYLNKISGPLLDRIDLHIEVHPVALKRLSQNEKAESSVEVGLRVLKARAIQSDRFKDKPIRINAEMSPANIRSHCALDASSSRLLEIAITKLGLSARAYHRILRIARTIADLDGSTGLLDVHVSEAIQYRTLDRLKLAA